MKLFISADLEGVNGVVSPGDIIPGETGYEAACLRLTEEINAVIKGLYQAGATEVTVCDAHEDATNIRHDLLDERAAVISGAGRSDSMVHGIDESYDGLILLGHHAMFGTEKALLDHSFDQTLIRELKLNDVPYGEVGINALVAAEKNVPLIMATGDDALEKEAKAFYPEVEVAVVKKAEGRYSAFCLPKAVCYKRLTECAKRAVETIKQKKCVSIPEEFVMGIVFQQTCMADGAQRVKGVTRTGAMEVTYRCESMMEYMRMRQVIFQAAAEFYDRRF